MDTVTSLKFSAELVCIQTLFKHLDEVDSEELSEYITSLLETDCFTAVSEMILHRIIRYFPENLSNRLLKALLPSHAKELSLTDCHHVSLMGLVDIFKKCKHLQKLNLSGCTQLMVPDIFTCMGLMVLPITAISVEGNQNVTDEIVQTIIRVLPNLHNLNISCCGQITDDVFLVEQEIQLRRETSKKRLTGALSEYKYKLSTVDISGCGGITSIAIRHLTSLSGPFLQHVNIAFTKIDSTALFSLAGYSFPTIIDFVLNGEEGMRNENDLKEYLGDLKEIAAIYGVRVSNKGDEENIDPDDSKHDSVIEGTPHTTASNSTGDADTKNLNSEELIYTTNHDGVLNQQVNTDSQYQGMEKVANDSQNHDVENHIEKQFEGLQIDIESSNDKMNVPGNNAEANSDSQPDYIGKKLVLERDKTVHMENLSLNDLETDEKPDIDNIVTEVGENQNCNRQDLNDFEKSTLSQFDLSEKPDRSKILVNNYVEHQETSIKNESELCNLRQADLTETGISKADVERACSECSNNKEFSDIVTKVNGKDGLHNDLNKNLACDIPGRKLICDVKSQNLSQDDGNQLLNCDGAKSFDIVTAAVKHSRNGDEMEISDWEENNLGDNEDSVRDGGYLSVGKSTHLPCKDQDERNLLDRNVLADVDLIEEDACLSENTSDLDDTGCNDTDDARNSEMCVIGSEQCNKCMFIKDLIVKRVNLNKAEMTNNGSDDYTDDDNDSGNETKCCDKSLSSSVNGKIDDIEHQLDEYIDNDVGKESNLAKDNLQDCDTHSSSSVKGKMDDNARVLDTCKDIDFGNEINGDLMKENLQDSSNSFEDVIGDIEHKLDTIERKLDDKLDGFKEAGDQITQLYTSNITSLNIENIKFPSESLGKLCLDKFLSVNKNLRSLKINWKGLSENLLKSLLPSLSGLQEISVEECTWLQSGGVAAIAKNCPDLKKVNLRGKGVVFIKDMGMVQYLVLPDLISLDLAESEVTDTTLKRLANRCTDKLTELDLSWCEEITERGVNEICMKCSKLEVLTLKRCPVSDKTLSLMAENCRQMRELIIESVEDVTTNLLSDVGISEMAQNLRYLRKLDISWNLSITDASINVIMSQCILLEEAYMKGLKQITGEAFFPIIADFLKWRKCQALLKFKKQEREYLQAQGEESYSSDEEYEALMIPHRSRSYAPNLRVLDLEYSDLVEDDRLMEIVSVCRGSLKIFDYYRQELKPRLFIKK